MEYRYAQGDLLENPNTYFYSEYGGEAFLDGWSETRSKVKRSLPLSASGPVHPETGNAVLETAMAIAKNLESGASLPSHIETLLRRFEVTKRVFDAYDQDIRPVDRAAYNTLDNYVRLAEVFETGYANNGDLRLLNGLLKIIDILCAYHSALKTDLGVRLARLIDRERSHVHAVGRRIGISVP